MRRSAAFCGLAAAVAGLGVVWWAVSRERALQRRIDALEGWRSSVTDPDVLRYPAVWIPAHIPPERGATRWQP